MMSPTSIIVNNASTIGTTTPPLTKPKRPLSSYNLFYRFKRQHIIELQSNNANKDQIMQLIDQSPGLEDVYSVPKDVTPDEINEIRKANIVNDMKDNLSPRETAKRRHRKNKNAMNGEVGFIELGKLMNASWKTCDEFAKVRSVFSSYASSTVSRTWTDIRNILLISCVLFLLTSYVHYTFFRLSLTTWPV